MRYHGTCVEEENFLRMWLGILESYMKKKKKSELALNK